MRPERLLSRVLGGDVANIGFGDLVRLVEALGLRLVGGRGSHEVFAHPEISELLNLQEDGGQASDTR